MFILLFVFEFSVLFILARFLIKSLSKLFFRITKSEKITIILLSYLFFPGTIIHELAHLFAAGLLFVQAGKMDLTPKIVEDGVRLGSVEIGKTDLLRRAIIGFAPVLVGASVIFGTLFYLETLTSTNVLIYIISFFIIFEVSNTLFSSKKDLEGTLEFLLTSAILIAAVFVIKPEIMQSSFGIFQKREVVNFFKNADLFLVVPLAINIVIIGLVNALMYRR